MKCQIEWVDKNGKPTPDENDAVAMAHFHASKIEVTDMSRGHVKTIYLPEIEQSFPVCGEHLAQVKYSWKYGSGGGWEFEPLEGAK